MTATARTWDHSFACGIHDDQPCTCKEDSPVSGATYRIEEYDRLSILYDDAFKALAEAEAILAAAGRRGDGLSVATGAAVKVCEYLNGEIERYAHSVKA